MFWYVLRNNLIAKQKEKMDRTLILLTISDILVLSGFGLVTPILAIFIKEDLVGGSVAAAGIAVGIFWGLKSILQLPFSRIIDSRRKKARFLIFGTFLIAFVPFIYILAKSVYHIYIAQAVYAIGAALAYPAWISLFTIHLNKKHRGFEWAIWSTGIGLGTGISAFIGAGLVSVIGFRAIFLIVGALSIIGMFILFFLDRSYERKLMTLDGLIHQRKIHHLKK